VFPGSWSFNRLAGTARTAGNVLPMKNNSENTFIISDTHFDHENIISYCNREFKNKDDMNTFLPNSWNNIVRDSDTVYFLGDLQYGRGSHHMQYWLDKLNGNIIFIAR
jgi:calcineurin-like phosphoesterase family protein